MTEQPETPSLGQRAFDLFKPPFRYCPHSGYIYDAKNCTVALSPHTQGEMALADEAGRQLVRALNLYWKCRKFGPLKNPRRWTLTTSSRRPDAAGKWVKWEDHKAAVQAILALPPLDWDSPPEVVPDDAYAQTLNFGGPGPGPYVRAAVDVSEDRFEVPVMSRVWNGHIDYDPPPSPDTATPILLDRLREIAYRDSAKAVTVRTDDLKAVLRVAVRQPRLVDDCNRLAEKLRVMESTAMAYRNQDVADKVALRDSCQLLLALAKVEPSAQLRELLELDEPEQRHLELTTIDGKVALQMLDNPGEPNDELRELLKLDRKPAERTITFTQESLAAALADVRCLHDLGVEFIAEGVFTNHFGVSPK